MLDQQPQNRISEYHKQNKALPKIRNLKNTRTMEKLGGAGNPVSNFICPGNQNAFSKPGPTTLGIEV